MVSFWWLTSQNLQLESMVYILSVFPPISSLFCLFFIIFTPHAQCEWGKVISVGVHIYIYILYVSGQKKNLNRTLEIDSPFQTFAVGLLVEFID